MIKLNSSATAQYNYLAQPPTHALLTSINAVFQPFENGIQMMKLNYQLGTITADGNFVVSQFANTMEITWPTPYMGALHDVEFKILEELFVAGFDFTTADIDNICIANVPGLSGEIVAVPTAAVVPPATPPVANS